MIQPLTALQVIQLRYRSHHFVGRRQRALGTYRAQDVYAAAGVPVHLCEPSTPPGRSRPRDLLARRRGYPRWPLDAQPSHSEPDGPSIP